MPQSLEFWPPTAKQLSAHPLPKPVNHKTCQSHAAARTSAAVNSASTSARTRSREFANCAAQAAEHGNMPHHTKRARGHPLHSGRGHFARAHDVGRVDKGKERPEDLCRTRMGAKRATAAPRAQPRTSGCKWLSVSIPAYRGALSVTCSTRETSSNLSARARTRTRPARAGATGSAPHCLAAPGGAHGASTRVARASSIRDQGRRGRSHHWVQGPTHRARSEVDRARNGAALARQRTQPAHTPRPVERCHRPPASAPVP